MGAAAALRVTITSLEMRSRPSSLARRRTAPPGTRIERAERPTVAFYRFLYAAVGEPWLWSDRRRWSDAALAARVQHPAVEIWVLSVGGQPAGYAELDRRAERDVELSYFGLMPEFIGQGFGGSLLRFALERAWSTAIDRVSVNTCDLDHPAALGLYRRAGFAPVRIDTVTIEDPRGCGLLPRSAAPHRPMAPG